MGIYSICYVAQAASNFFSETWERIFGIQKLVYILPIYPIKDIAHKKSLPLK